MNSTTPSNILIIICDQLSATALRSYGNTYASTPNIDKLINEGVRFNNAYCASPLCQPARAAFWTGLHCHETGVLSNGRKFPAGNVSEEVPTLGSIFSEAGYRAVHFGKTHDAGSLRGFEVSPKPQRKLSNPDPDWDLKFEGWIDEDTRKKTVSFLQEYSETPFIAVADLQNPHNICSWIGKHQDIREFPEKGDLPDLPQNLYIEDMEKRPSPVQYICCAHNRQAQISEWNENGVRHYLKAYHEYLTQVDGEIGKILEALENRPDCKNTLVVFFADHGDSMFGRWMATKHTSFYDETARIPFAFSGPGINGKNRVVQGPVSQLDLISTLCDYAGLEIPDRQHGKSLLPWLKEDHSSIPNEFVVSQWHTEWGYTIEPGRMVRSQRYKYTRFLEGNGEELYDLKTDPGETRTLIDDPNYSEILNQQRAMLEEHIRETNDPFFSMEWKAAKCWRSHKPGFQHHRGIAAPQSEA